METESSEPRRRTGHLTRWGAVYVLLLLFAGSWAGQFVTQFIEVRDQDRQTGHVFAWADFIPQFLSSTLENWQSEWLQLIFQAILLLGARHLMFRADAIDTERLEAKIDDIQRRLPAPAPTDEGDASR